MSEPNPDRTNYPPWAMILFLLIICGTICYIAYLILG